MPVLVAAADQKINFKGVKGGCIVRGDKSILDKSSPDESCV